VSGRLVRWVLSLGHRRRARRGATLTIVRHHRVLGADQHPLYRLGVTEEVLDGQLALLARLGLAPLTVEEGLARLASGPGHWVAMTFDDGYADNVHRALPRLSRHGGKATFYLTAGLMEERVAPWWDRLEHLLERTTRPALEWDAGGAPLRLPLGGRAERRAALEALVPRLRVAPDEQRRRLDALAAALGVSAPAPCELATWPEAARLAEAGMEVGAHTLTHPFLSLLPPAGQRAEIAGSIETIERRLGVRPRGLAYPGGDHDDVTVEVAGSLGLSHAVTTRRGDNGPATPRLRLSRRGLSEGACLGPGGRFSRRLAAAELDGAFDRLRGAAEAAT
jgi:peptidoglycan/xylan/chitin deacetylase (PgdA/CDA1 family)